MGLFLLSAGLCFCLAVGFDALAAGGADRTVGGIWCGGQRVLEAVEGGAGFDSLEPGAACFDVLLG